MKNAGSVIGNDPLQNLRKISETVLVLSGTITVLTVDSEAHKTRLNVGHLRQLKALATGCSRHWPSMLIVASDNSPLNGVGERVEGGGGLKEKW